MATTFEVNERLVWMPQSGAFSLAVELIAVELEASNPRFSHELMEIARGAGPMPFVNLKDMEAHEFRAVVAAAENGFERMVSLGPGFLGSNPAAFWHIAALFSELKGFLRYDPRADSAQPRETTILLPSGSSLVRNACIGDAALEHVAMAVWDEDPSLSTHVLKGRSSASNTDVVCDLRTLDGRAVARLQTSADMLLGYYSDRTGWLSYAPEFSTALVDLLMAFRQGLERAEMTL